jgi:hypothetical protein
MVDASPPKQGCQSIGTSFCVFLCSKPALPARQSCILSSIIPLENRDRFGRPAHQAGRNPVGCIRNPQNLAAHSICRQGLPSSLISKEICRQGNDGQFALETETQKLFVSNPEGGQFENSRAGGLVHLFLKHCLRATPAWLHATFGPEQLKVFKQGGHPGNLSNPDVQKAILAALTPRRPPEIKSPSPGKQRHLTMTSPSHTIAQLPRRFFGADISDPRRRA